MEKIADVEKQQAGAKRAQKRQPELASKFRAKRIETPDTAEYEQG